MGYLNVFYKKINYHLDKHKYEFIQKITIVSYFAKIESLCKIPKGKEN